MKLIDIFPYFIDDKKCLFCNNIVSYLKHISTARTSEFYCYSCKESFAVDYVLNIEYFFTFSLFEKEFVINLQSERLGTYNSSNKLSWVPYFKLDFSNKEKLLEKIKTYTLFS